MFDKLKARFSRHKEEQEPLIAYEEALSNDEEEEGDGSEEPLSSVLQRAPQQEDAPQQENKPKVLSAQDKKARDRKFLMIVVGASTIIVLGWYFLFGSSSQVKQEGGQGVANLPTPNGSSAAAQRQKALAANDAALLNALQQQQQNNTASAVVPPPVDPVKPSGITPSALPDTSNKGTDPFSAVANNVPPQGNNISPMPVSDNSISPSMQKGETNTKMSSPMKSFSADDLAGVLQEHVGKKLDLVLVKQDEILSRLMSGARTGNENQRSPVHSNEGTKKNIVRKSDTVFEQRMDQMPVRSAWRVKEVDQGVVILQNDKGEMMAAQAGMNIPGMGKIVAVDREEGVIFSNGRVIR